MMTMMETMTGRTTLETGLRRPTAPAVQRTVRPLAALALLAALAGSAGPVRAQLPEARTLTLEGAISRALDANPQVRAARQGLAQAREQVSEAWGNVFPSLELSTTYTRNFSPPVSFLPAQFVDPDAPTGELVLLQFGADNVWNLSLDVEQPLFNAAAFIGVGAAGRFESLQTEVVRGQVQEVVTRVRTAYYDLLLSQEQRRLVENSLRRVRATLEETRALNEAGLASEYDVLRLEVEEANLLPSARRAENAVVQAKRTLAVELDLPVEEAASLQVAGSLAEMELDAPGDNSADNQAILAMARVGTESEVEAVVSRAMTSRSDVRQLEATEDLRQTELRLEQVEYLPQISLFGSYGITAQENGSPNFFGDPRGYARLAGIRLSLPIFSGFQRDARIDQQRAVLEQARAETRFTRSRAAAEVRNLVDQVEESRIRARGQRLAVRQAQRGFEIASAQYREGISSQLELTDAEVALRESEFNYAQAVYDFLVARARLDAAVGDVPLAGEIAP